jgi:F-box protein 11
MAAKTPLAFLSYAHSDDSHENGKLLIFAERLSGEVRMQWGAEFPIFIDREDLKWGQEWKRRLDESLDGVTLLIPILTPGYFKSESCRNELRRFLKREEHLGRKDLILPVYYVRSPALEDEAKRAADELAQVLHERQYKNWRHLRHEPWTTPEVGRLFEQMALEVVEALERSGSPQPAVAPKAVVVSEATASQLATPSRAEPATDRKSAPSEPHTVVVDAMRRGNYTTISQAIRKEHAGTRILVRPGHYREGLVIKKVLDIVGEGNREDVVVEATGKDVVLFQAPMGRMANLTLRQAGGGELFAVDIAQGRLDLEDCDITSQSLAAIAIHGGAEPRVRRNRIHDGKASGVFVNENGAGLIEDNEIFGNAQSGVVVSEGGNPTVRRNRIHDGKQVGIHVYENGAGVIEDNDILSNTYSGVAVREGGNPVVRGNRIRGNREGIRVHKGGRGTFENNVLEENKDGAWDIAEDCVADVKRSGNLES